MRQNAVAPRPPQRNELISPRFRSSDRPNDVAILTIHPRRSQMSNSLLSPPVLYPPCRRGDRGGRKLSEFRRDPIFPATSFPQSIGNPLALDQAPISYLVS